LKELERLPSAGGDAAEMKYGMPPIIVEGYGSRVIEPSIEALFKKSAWRSHDASEPDPRVSIRWVPRSKASRR
jgi:hypothetical protein